MKLTFWKITYSLSIEVLKLTLRLERKYENPVRIANTFCSIIGRKFAHHQ